MLNKIKQRTDWMLNRTVNWMNVEQKTDWMVNRIRPENWLMNSQTRELTESWTENWLNDEQSQTRELAESWTENWLNGGQRPNKPSADQRNVETGVSLRLEYLYVTWLGTRETAAVSVHVLCTPHNHLPVYSASLSEVTYVSCMRV